MREWCAATTAEAVAEFAAALGVSPPALAAVGAAWAAPYSAWAFPMCDGYGNVVGIRLRNERGKFAVRGSRQEIFLASVAAQKTLFVCEGPTDTAAAAELGLFAVGRPNCCCGGPEIQVFARRMACRRVPGSCAITLTTTINTAAGTSLKLLQSFLISITAHPG